MRFISSLHQATIRRRYEAASQPPVQQVWKKYIFPLNDISFAYRVNGAVYLQHWQKTT